MAFARHPPSRTEPGVSARLNLTLADQEFRKVRPRAPIGQACDEVEARSSDTPGPMVEDSDTFLT